MNYIIVYNSVQQYYSIHKQLFIYFSFKFNLVLAYYIYIILFMFVHVLCNCLEFGPTFFLLQIYIYMCYNL